MKDSVVVFNDILQSREPAVMIEPAIRVAPESGKWRCTVHVCRRAVRLERIHTDLARSMKVVPRLREKRRHMAARTFALAISWNTRGAPDKVTSKLAALHFYQLAIPAPKPPDGSFNKGAAERGKEVFIRSSQQPDIAGDC